MGKLLAVNYLLRQTKTIQKKYQPTLTIGPVSLSFVTIILVLILAVFYLVFSTQLTSRGYELEKIKAKKVELLAENERLEIETSRLQSLRKIEEAAKEVKMVPTEKVYYTSPQEGVALR